MNCAGATTYRTVLNVDRGLSWEEALAMRDAYVAEVRTAGAAVDPLVGFHLFTNSKEIGKTGAPLIECLHRYQPSSSMRK